MKISYLITVADEEKEFRKLYETLRINKREQDNILVLVDENKCPRYSDFHNFLDELYLSGHVTTIYGKFDGHFANWKNKLKTHFKADGDYLVWLDADELLPPQLIDDLPQILELNPDVDVLGFPRINMVKNIGLSDVERWGWNISKLEQFQQEKTFNLDNQDDLDQYNLLKKYNLIIEEN